MPEYICSSGAWPADYEILPADLPPPNPHRLFFVRITVEFNNPDGETTRVIKELFIQMDEETGLAREAWGTIHNALNDMESPDSAIGETIAQLTCCALQMVNDPANAPRLVIPMEALVTCVIAEEEGSSEVRREELVTVEAAAECVVCLAEMRVGRRLVCMHVFHESCIGEWFTYNRTCPICRYS